MQLHIGTAENMGQRFIDAWHPAESGEEVNETHLTFFDLETLLSTLTTQRLKLLRYVHQPGAKWPRCKRRWHSHTPMLSQINNFKRVPPRLWKAYAVPSHGFWPSVC